MNTSGYVIVDPAGTVVCGYSLTSTEEAWEHASDGIELEDGCRCLAATGALLRLVQAEGGAVPFAVVGEVACTPDEEESGEEEPAPRARRTWMVCPVCEGEGTTVDPAIDGNGLTREDFDEDPDFGESYWSGAFDITCRACKGKRVVDQDRLGELERNADARRLAARENGDWEAYAHARDYRYG